MDLEQLYKERCVGVYPIQQFGRYVSIPPDLLDIQINPDLSPEQLSDPGILNTDFLASQAVFTALCLGHNTPGKWIEERRHSRRGCVLQRDWTTCGNLAFSQITAVGTGLTTFRQPQQLHNPLLGLVGFKSRGKDQIVTNLWRQQGISTSITLAMIRVDTKRFIEWWMQHEDPSFNRKYNLPQYAQYLLDNGDEMGIQIRLEPDERIQGFAPPNSPEAIKANINKVLISLLNLHRKYSDITPERIDLQELESVILDLAAISEIQGKLDSVKKAIVIFANEHHASLTTVIKHSLPITKFTTDHNFGPCAYYDAEEAVYTYELAQDIIKFLPDHLIKIFASIYSTESLNGYNEHKEALHEGIKQIIKTSH